MAPGIAEWLKLIGLGTLGGALLLAPWFVVVYTAM